MKKFFFFSLILCIASFSFLRADELIQHNFNFSLGSNGWKGEFSEYPVGEEAFYELSWGWENLPSSINLVKEQSNNQGPGDAYAKGLFLAGNNHSDDLFMFAKKQITGLKPNTYYGLFFDVLLETNVPTEQMGVGGSPGEAVYIKVGGSTEEPKKQDSNGFYILNVDKGDQSIGSDSAVILGDIANPDVDSSNPSYKPKTLYGRNPVRVKSDDKGRLWIFVGSDSGFESYTKYYIVEVNLRAEVAPF